jgi:lipid II:glycine glycyltransferase (peptidoglycan interpeptide bridge formation enzyme)
LENGPGFVVSAHVDGAPAAAAIFLAWNGIVTYKYGAFDRTYAAYRPNNLLMWSVIKWACERGYHTFEWGNTGLDDA